MNPVRNSLEPKKTLRCLRDVYVSKTKETKGNSGRKKGWWPGFIYESRKPVGFKKGACQREAQGSGSSIPENVWTRLKFFDKLLCLFRCISEPVLRLVQKVGNFLFVSGTLTSSPSLRASSTREGFLMIPKFPS